jgi:membrane protease YdiL (CAAX protease family)
LKILNQIFQKVIGDSFYKHHANQNIDKKIILTFFISIFSLVAIFYLNSFQKTLDFIHSLGFENITNCVIQKTKNTTDFQLLDLSYWALCSFFFYFIAPFVVIRFIWKEPLSAYGFSLNEATKGMKYYVLFLLFMLPLVWMVSYTNQFQNSYPFYKLQYPNASLNHFIIWQCFYFLQFLGLEFFFRGFMIHALKIRFGFYAIFIMMIPYCMIHFGKPWPETIGAIFAGIILGSMSLKSNSIWFGVLLHYSVAISMDIFSLMHQ